MTAQNRMNSVFLPLLIVVAKLILRSSFVYGLGSVFSSMVAIPQMLLSRGLSKYLHGSIKRHLVV